MTQAPPSRGRRIGGIAARAAAFLLALPLLYLLAALLLGAIAANGAWRPAGTDGVTIFLRTNGVHTWIVMPKVTPEMDWRPYAPPEHLRDPRYGFGDHVAIGYGNREFYLNTPTWADLRPDTALAAAAGLGPALVHVDHDHRPVPTEWQRPLRISRDQYRRLARHVRASFRLDQSGRTVPLLGRGYSDWDMFYESDGGYDLVYTCNEWTGRALRAAGIRTGLWTPFSQSIMWRVD